MPISERRGGGLFGGVVESESDVLVLPTAGLNKLNNLKVEVIVASDGN
jgi:hypothetical protein